MVHGSYPRRVVWVECQRGGTTDVRLMGTGYPGTVGIVNCRWMKDVVRDPSMNGPPYGWTDSGTGASGERYCRTGM